jgi:polyhydroxyalkanoate synthesis regulator phasin
VHVVGTTVSIATESGIKKFDSFDGVFDVTADQSHVYAAVNEVMDFSRVVNGEVITMLAYGQTGGGKVCQFLNQVLLLCVLQVHHPSPCHQTHTIYGDIWKIDPLGGLLPRAAEAIFNEACALPVEEQSKLAVHVTFISLYNEEINDLLDDSRRKGALTIKESRLRGAYVQNLHEEAVASVEDAIEQMRRGMQNMMVACTAMEISMSCMQTIFTIAVSRSTSVGSLSAEPSTAMAGVEPSTTVERQIEDLALVTAPLSVSQEALSQPPSELQSLQQVGKLVFVDLAGSERCSKAGASAAALRESSNISRSLSALGAVIACLGDGSRHVPYRDSKLTRLLQYALRAGAKTAFIGAVTCWARDAMETLCVLRFLQRVWLCHRHPASGISTCGMIGARVSESAEQEVAVTARVATNGTEI